MFITRYRHEVLEQNYMKSLTNNDNEMTPEDQLRYNELKKNLSRALANMSEKQRTVFLMSRMEGLKYQEIAERLNISVKAVEKRMHLTLVYLRKVLE
jgi:RNA polymerase sigma factor (sigma-70 family)